MTIPARYSGVCPECGERWQPGDPIRPDTTVPRPEWLWVHDTCPDIVFAVRPAEITCPVCWLIHPAGACDR